MIFIPHYLCARRSTSKLNPFSRSGGKDFTNHIMSCGHCSQSKYKVDSEPGKTIKSKSKSKSI